MVTIEKGNKYVQNSLSTEYFFLIPSECDSQVNHREVIMVHKDSCLI